MALNELYIVASDLEQLFRNKDTGLPLANGKIKFYRDAARDEPKEVFQLSGVPPNYSYTSMGAEINLNAIGVVQNSVGDNEVIYYYPWIVNNLNQLVLDLYYVVVYDENDIPQFDREAWPNITAGTSPIDDNTLKNTNQIANPQFTNIFLNEGFDTTFNISGTDNTFILAPDWDLVASGTGTVVISRQSITGNNNVITSPPYVLDINVSAGITSCYLRQRMNKNSGLWASTTNFPIYLSGCIVGRNENAGEAGIQIIYQESSGNPPVTILDKKFNNTGYSLQVGSSGLIPFSTNVNSGDSGYIDILVSILPLSHIRITSIQVAVSQQNAGEDFISYDTNSSNREEALQGDYFLPNLSSRPAKSLLVGWDFPVNPSQFSGSGTITTGANYIVDQTIGFTSNSTTSWARSSATDAIQCVNTAANATAILQYMSGQDARRIIGADLSVNLFSYRISTTADITVRVYIYRGSSAATIPTLTSTIGTLAANGVFTLSAANWTEIPRSGLDTAKATLPYLSTFANLDTVNVDTGFTGWRITNGAEIIDTNKFAVVVTFSCPDANSAFEINSVSLIPSAIPSRPAPQTRAEVLAECQYYYEDSYSQGSYPGDATTGGAIIVEQSARVPGVGTLASYPRFINYQYKTEKRLTSVIPSIYSTTGANDNFNLQFYRAGVVVAGASANIPVASAFSTFGIGSTGFSFAPLDQGTAMTTFVPGGVVADTNIEAVIMFHYRTDARLGVV